MSPMETRGIRADHKSAHGICKPKLIPVNTNFHLQSFIRPECTSLDYTKKQPSHQVEGGTRWNPSEEQIGILEMLYRSGMRTPTAHQIEHITAQLGQYGKIKGKNVFYWFQNHKARERQKQKRKVEEELSSSSAGGCAPYKRKCKSSALDQCSEEVENRTLKLFPLHPEGGLRDA